MQLVAYGAQDVYLTGNPKVTFFQAVYKRHTNFAMENIEQTVNGTAAASGRVSVTVARNGDLVGDMYVELLNDAELLQSGAATGADAANSWTGWVAERAISPLNCPSVVKESTNTTKDGGDCTLNCTWMKPRELTTVR